MPRRVTPDQIVARLQREARELGSQRALAAHYGMSPSFLGRIMGGQAVITEGLAARMGYRRELTFWAD